LRDRRSDPSRTRSPRPARGTLAILFALLIATGGSNAQAQELSPRAYWPSPVGTRVLISGYAYQDGDVLLDATLPIYGVDSRINTAVLGYLQSVDLWGRNANVLLEMPYSWGSTRGILGNQPARADFAGFNDPSATLSVNLIGAPAMTPEEFQAFRAAPRPILGASVKVVVPTGHYEPDRFINVGANRWAARLQLGTILSLHRRWLLEVDGGVWLFGDDSDYLGGRREQDPIYALEAHLVHRIRPGLWASLDANWFTGGETDHCRCAAGRPAAERAARRHAGFSVSPASCDQAGLQYERPYPIRE
jgi:hypothetical protein